jgi:hypothetical protein
MNKMGLILAVVLFTGAAFCGQKETEQRPTLGPEPAPSRPTLGSNPSLNGPLTATTMNAAMLRRVKKVYVGLMDNKLNLKLIDDFAKQGPFRVVSTRNDADAILQGTCFDSAHMKEVHSEVFLTGRDGKAIWQDVIHEPYRPPSLSQAVSETAELIVTHLHQSLAQTGRK